MAYTKYSLTPANNNATPPDGAPEGMLPSAVNDTMRDMMAQIRDVGDGIRDGTYTMTAAKITGGTITGVAFTGNTFTSPVISGGSINNTPIGATTANTGAFTTLSATGVTTVQAGTVSAPAITTSGDTNTGIFFPAADTIAFTEGGAEAMRIDSAGRLLIGLTTAYDNATLGITTPSQIFSLIADGGTTGNRSRGGFYHPATKVFALNVDQADGVLAFTQNTTERMRIDSSGNVGIGNTNPSAPLDIQSNSGGTGIRVRGRATANAGAIRYFANDNTTQRARIESNDTSFEINSIANLPITISTNDTERMRITSAGFLCLGTTSKNNDGLLSISADSSLHQGITIKDLNAGNNIYYVYFTNSSGSGAGRIEHTGATTVSYVTSSDARLKTNIVDSASAQPIIESIKIREFDWVSGEHQRFGVVAQELIDVAPEAVSVGRKEDDSWGVDYSKLVPHLIKYVQELNAKVEAQAAEIALLKSK
jgi:hypothetical protein